jgi:hypothetical protein
VDRLPLLRPRIKVARVVGDYSLSLSKTLLFFRKFVTNIKLSSAHSADSSLTPPRPSPKSTSDQNPDFPLFDPFLIQLALESRTPPGPPSASHRR